MKPEDAVPSREFQAYTYTLDPSTPAPDVTRLAVSPDGKQVATGTRTGSGTSELNVITASVHIFSLSDGSLLGAPLDDKGFGEPEALSYTPDGRFLLVAHGGNHVEHLVHILDTQSLQLVDTVHLGSSIYSEAIRPDSGQFAVSAGSSIDIWSLRNTQ